MKNDKIIGLMISFEQGETTTDETLELFSHLIKTGMAYSLQGFYGRYAQNLIEAGYINEQGVINENIRKSEVA
jgi:hypothetical protein